MPLNGQIEVPEDYLRQEVPLAAADQEKKLKISLSVKDYAQIIHLSLTDALAEMRKELRKLAGIEAAHKEIKSLDDYKLYMPSLKKLVSGKGSASQAFRLCSICYNFRAQRRRKTSKCSMSARCSPARSTARRLSTSSRSF